MALALSNAPRTGASEYPHFILNSGIFQSLPTASANFQRDLKFHGPRCSLERKELIKRSIFLIRDCMKSRKRSIMKKATEAGYILPNKKFFILSEQ